MMSLEAIRHINNEIAAEAAKAKKVPYVPASPDERRLLAHIPNLGYFVPDGWRETEAVWFVDKTGRGARRARPDHRPVPAGVAAACPRQPGARLRHHGGGAMPNLHHSVRAGRFGMTGSCV